MKTLLCYFSRVKIEFSSSYFQEGQVIFSFRITDGRRTRLSADLLFLNVKKEIKGPLQWSLVIRCYQKGIRGIFSGHKSANNDLKSLEIHKIHELQCGDF